jgi:hypothetical protein
MIFDMNANSWTPKNGAVELKTKAERNKEQTHQLFAIDPPAYVPIKTG